MWEMYLQGKIQRQVHTHGRKTTSKQAQRNAGQHHVEEHKHTEGEKAHRDVKPRVNRQTEMQDNIAYRNIHIGGLGSET